MDQKLIDKLVKREQEGTLRSLSCERGLVDFYSNDYLGLSRIETPAHESSYASTGSRLLSGTSEEALNAERKIAELFKSEESLIFNSGYDANIGFFSAVLQRGDTIFYDEYIHASVRDGIRLSFAHAHSFKHNDLVDLEFQLERTEGIKYIAVESLYSMNGDFAPLANLVELTEKYNAYLVVDEAHAAGVFNKGIAVDLNCESRLFARLITFGKAYGAHGAAILGSKKLIQYLYNFSRSFIYTTALPPAAYYRIEKINEGTPLVESRKALTANIVHFRKLMEGIDLISSQQSPIQVIQLGDVELLKSISKELHRENIMVKAIFSPTVPSGKERLRICIHSFNRPEEIEKLINIIRSFLN